MLTKYLTIGGKCYELGNMEGLIELLYIETGGMNS